MSTATLVVTFSLVFSAVTSAQSQTVVLRGSINPKPNVILLTLDTVRADHLSFYGYQRPTTPYLSGLARSATTFSNTVAAGDMTLTSHGAIFTGLYGSWNGAHVTSDHVLIKGVLSTSAHAISSRRITIPQLLSEHGYTTIAVVANTAFLLPMYGFARGFDIFEANNVDPKTHHRIVDRATQQRSPQAACSSVGDVTTRTAEEINRDAFRLLDDSVKSERPFFLFLNYLDAHDPYAPPSPFDTRFPGKDCSIRWDMFLPLYRELAQGRGTVPERVRRHYTSQYDGALAYMDDQIRKLILKLQVMGKYENTLIIITGDHGEALGDRNQIGHGLSVSHDQVDVPLLIKFPMTSARRIVAVRVSQTDILPTIMEVIGIAPSQFIQGRSLLRDSGLQDREILSESFPNPLLGTLKRDRIERALYRKGLKFVGSTSGKRELYDLDVDPNETHDICAVEAARCHDMERLLENWTRSASFDLDNLQ